MELTIREANYKDINYIHLLNKKSLPIYYSVYDLFLLSLSSNNMLLVAETDNKIIGYTIGKYTDKNNFHILSIAVDDDYRSKGVGKKLLNYLNNKIEGKSITLYVHTENIKGIKFYENNGFVKQEKIENYYGGMLKSTSQDAFKMIKYPLKNFISLKQNK